MRVRVKERSSDRERVSETVCVRRIDRDREWGRWVACAPLSGRFTGLLRNPLARGLPTPLYVPVPPPTSHSPPLPPSRAARPVRTRTRLASTPYYIYYYPPPPCSLPVLAPPLIIPAAGIVTISHYTCGIALPLPWGGPTDLKLMTPDSPFFFFKF